MLNPSLKNANIRLVFSGDLNDILSINMDAGLENWSKKSYLDYVSSKKAVFKLIEVGSYPVGFYLTTLVMDESELLKIAVVRNYRGSGFGQLLLNDCFETLDIQDVREIHLEVRESNRRAIRFYERNGFETTGFRNHYYLNPIENAILMSKRLVGS
jgi:ribosomal-protein-alanine N-acetyltransferase